MEKKIIMAVLCIMLATGSTACVAKPAETAATGGAPRIVSTSVPICEMMDRLDLDLVGVPKTSAKLPDRYKNVTAVGLPMTPDMEIIRALNPTDVISPNSLQYDLKPKYENAQVPSTFVNLMSVEGMLKSVEQLGEKYGRRTEAEKIIQEYQDFMAEYNDKIAGEKKPKVLILMGLPGSYMVSTDKSYVGNLVRLAGGENVFKGDQAFLNLNTEAIVQTDPDMILRAAHGLPEEVKKSFEKEFRENDIWKHFRAVQNGKIYDLAYGTFGMSASLHYQEALNELYIMLYGN